MAAEPWPPAWLQTQGNLAFRTPVCSKVCLKKQVNRWPRGIQSFTCKCEISCCSGMLDCAQKSQSSPHILYGSIQQMPSMPQQNHLTARLCSVLSVSSCLALAIPSKPCSRVAHRAGELLAWKGPCQPTLGQCPEHAEMFI